MKTIIHLNLGLIPSEAMNTLVETTHMNLQDFEQRKCYDEWRCRLNELIDAEISLEQVMELSRTFDVEVCNGGIYLEYNW